MKITAKQIKEARTTANITQLEAARKIGVSIEAYRRWEQGGGSPKAANLEKIRVALNIN